MEKNYLRIRFLAMKHLAFIAFFTLILGVPGNVFGQCPNDNTLYLSTTPACTGAQEVMASCIYGGEYNLLYVTAGTQYTVSTCGDTDFDTQITVYSEPDGTMLGYNDDFCGAQSSVTFTAGYTGGVRVLVDEYPCLSESTCMTLRVTCSSAAGDPCSSVTNLSCGSTENYSLAVGSGVWDNLGGP